jgi:uncharacterized protein YjbI with pentapeptide repeats
MRRLVTLLVVLLWAQPVVALVVFRDGERHVIDADNSYPSDDVWVQTPGHLPPTEVVLVAGGEIGGSVDVLSESSSFEMTGGAVGDVVTAWGRSTVTISGGEVNANNPSGCDYQGLVAQHYATVTVRGGLVCSVRWFSQGTLNFEGGIGETISIYSGATLNMTGGTLTGKGDAPTILGDARISGGEVNATGSAILSRWPYVEISGGVFNGDVQAGEIDGSQWGQVVISGGSFNGSLLAIGDNSLITVVGADFNLPYGDITAASGTLTGNLADGTPIDVPFSRPGTGTITLACPSAGFLAPTSGSLAKDQNNYCEDWPGVVQPGTDLSRAGLSTTVLTGANLSGSNLTDADLSLAELSGADLSGANLTDADLSLVELSGADLSGATVIGTEWMDSTYDEATVFPSGTTYDSPDWNWGLEGGATPWDLGMRYVPEPDEEQALAAGLVALLVLDRRRRNRNRGRRQPGRGASVASRP